MTVDRRSATADQVLISVDDHARLLKKRHLQAARSRVLERLQSACDRRHRAELEQSLADIDADLAGL